MKSKKSHRKIMPKIILILAVVILVIPIAFALINPMDFYSFIFLTWVLADPEICGKLMAETMHMLVQKDHLKNVMTDDEWGGVQEYFEQKQTDLEKSVIEFDCVNVVENQYRLHLWPDMPNKVLEIWGMDNHQK